MLLSFLSADEHTALQFEDIASALDAGLPVQAIGGDSAQGERVLHGILQRRRAKLTAVEDAVLAAAWRTGRAGHALRRAATMRRQRAGLLKQLVQRLAYPVVLLGMSMLIAVMTHRPLVIWFAAACVGGLFVLLFLMRRGLRGGTGPWLSLPMIGPLLRDQAELPYLEVLHGLYSAGEPILEAHAAAVDACPTTAIRQQLREADLVLQGRVPLADALQQTGVLAAETRTLIAGGERVGELEDALWRALQRRTEVHAGRGRQLAMVVGTAAYLFAAGIAVYLIFAFYGSLYGR